MKLESKLFKPVAWLINDHLHWYDYKTNKIELSDH